MQIRIEFAGSSETAIDHIMATMKVIAAQIPGLSREQRDMVTQTLVREALGSTESAFEKALTTPVVAVNDVHGMTLEVKELFERSRPVEVSNLFNKMDMAIQVAACEQDD